MYGKNYQDDNGLCEKKLQDIAICKCDDVMGTIKCYLPNLHISYTCVIIHDLNTLLNVISYYKNE